MRPPELETKLETGAFGPDVLFTRYGDTPPNAVCIAPRTMPTAPGEALKIVKRLGLYSELVEMLGKVAHCWDGWTDHDNSFDETTVEALLARCKEVPK